MHGPGGHDDADEGEGKDLMGYGREAATAKEDGADGIDEVVHGVDVGGEVGPVGHGADGGEESAEQEEADDEEPHDEDGLLKGLAVVGYKEPEGGEEQGQEHGEQIDQQERPLTGDAVDEPREQEADRDNEKGYDPVWYELGKDEGELGDGGDVNLLDSAGFLLADDVQGWQETAHEHDDNGQQGGYHETLVALFLIVEGKHGTWRKPGTRGTHDYLT